MTAFGTIYSYSPNPRVMKIEAVANINGLEIAHAEFEMHKTNTTPEFLSKFPFGKVPAFEGADGTTLVESDAIAQYVAESGPASGQLLGTTTAQRAVVRQWINFADGEVMFPITQLVLWRIGLREFKEDIETTSMQRLQRALNFLESSLKGDRTWLATQDKLSLADITLATSLCWGFSMIIDEEMRKNYPNVVAFYERVTETDGVKQVFGEKKFVDKRQDYKAN